MNRVVIVGLVLGALAALVSAPLPISTASPAEKPPLPFDSLISTVGITATTSSLTTEPPSIPTGTPTRTTTNTPSLAAPLLPSPSNGAILPVGTDVTLTRASS